MKKHTRLSLLSILAVWLFLFSFYKPWRASNAMGGGDCTGYYMYLPAMFLQHDFKDLKQTIFERDKAAGIPRDSTKVVTDVGEVYIKDNIPIIKYTCGIAILESPAFLLAHLLSEVLKQPDTGFTKIYIFFIQLWNLLFAFAGLCLLSYVLSELFFKNDSVIAVTLFAIALGTNLLHFAVFNTGMSHPYLFTLYALLLFATINFYKDYALKYAALIGISAGMITLVRPNEIICLFIPFLYGIPFTVGLKERLTTLFKNKGFYVAVFLFAFCALPQLLYWKSQSGHWIYYSYGSETFDFKHSKIHGGLFGFKNGWLPYTPIMAFAIAGIGLMVLKRGETLLATLIFLPVHIYVIYSWWCWTYINGLGSRPMIETYALLSVPLATFTYVVQKNRIGFYLWILLVVFFASQQIMMTYQVSKNILWSEDSNQTFYRESFFKTHINMNDVIAYDTDEKQPEHAIFQHTIFLNDFEDSLNPHFVKGAAGTNGFAFLLDNKVVNAPEFERSLSECRLNPLDWVKISFDAYAPPPSGSLYGNAIMRVEFSKTAPYKSSAIRIQNKIQPNQNCGIWVFPCFASGRVYFYTRVPQGANPGDKLKVYGVNYSESPVVIDNLLIEAYR